MQTLAPIYEDVDLPLLPAWVMGLPSHLRVGKARATRLALAFLPLAMLLVGSCKTADMPSAYGGAANPDQFRIALFPDRVNFKGASYFPAEGYISRAQKFVSTAPETLEMLTEEEIGYVFGKPAFARKDAAAEVWQYKAGGCVVDFFFYGDNTPNARRVAYVDVRPDVELYEETVPSSQRVSCLKDVIDEGDFTAQRI